MSLRALGLVVGASAATLLLPGAVPAREFPPDVEVYVIGVDGNGRRNLSRNLAGPDTSPVVSRNGKTVAFLRGQAGSMDVWVMNTDGTGQAQRTTGIDMEADPAWGPDSRALAFTAFGPTCGSRAPSCASIRIVGWGGRQLTRKGLHARFSPNGRAVAFAQAAGISVLRRSRAGVSYRRLFRGAAADPAWSPAGKRLVFEQTVRNGGTYISVMNADGKKRRRLAAGSDPAWSARGLIAFERGGILVVQPNGRGLRTLTTGPSDSNATWSPDGTRLAFTRGPRFARQIWVIGADGRGLAPVTSEMVGVEGAPSWSPDGRRLYYAARTGKRPPPL